MGFEKYLERNSWVLNSHSDTKVISIHTLGEWAWKTFYENTKRIRLAKDGKGAFKDKKGRVRRLKKEYMNKLIHRNDVYINIALACLGKKEIDKRLQDAV